MNPDLEQALAIIGKTVGLDNPSLVGSLLRDQHGIPGVRVQGLRLTQLLGVTQSHYEELRLSERLTRLREHLKKNHKDYVVARTIVRLQAKLANLQRKR